MLKQQVMMDAHVVYEMEVAAGFRGMLRCIRTPRTRLECTIDPASTSVTRSAAQICGTSSAPFFADEAAVSMSLVSPGRAVGSDPGR
ncbi:hypothetical protein FAGKG844_130077 [Frankia sp. AgKG'84/4]